MLNIAPGDIELGQWDVECKHRETAVRKRIRRNGTAVFCEQCLLCGTELRAVSKTSPQVLSLSVIHMFDERIQTEWSDYKRSRWEQRQQQKQQELQAADAAWWASYNAYLKSKAWERKRVMVLDRAPGGLCEGCGVNLAVQVHHITYDHVGSEFLWELRAVCMDCHQRIHPEKDLRS